VAAHAGELPAPAVVPLVDDRRERRDHRHLGHPRGVRRRGARSRSVLVTAASAATITGALGLGGATWAEAAAERDAQLELVEEERAQLAADPAVEIDELTAFYERKRLAPSRARRSQSS